ncbi:hypothetical protein EYB31_38600 [Paenibacillus thalictri]|uniref:Uncharacterized protein n=2 Tax=Paenibacillus thalictri TaxID=2527873 RepID=A0A4Q9DGC3_9BACL|nr:hypothetical protein EYB31_38600 [Paenibacillus thalictri]
MRRVAQKLVVSPSQEQMDAQSHAIAAQKLAASPSQMLMNASKHHGHATPVRAFGIPVSYGNKPLPKKRRLGLTFARGFDSMLTSQGAAGHVQAYAGTWKQTRKSGSDRVEQQ